MSTPSAGVATERRPRGRPRNGRASGALAWSFTNTVVSRLGTLAIGVFLARLLGPEAFGTYAIAFVALVAVLSFNELGVSLAIVRWPGDPAKIAPTVTTISIVSSLLIAGGVYLAAPAFATAMGDADAAGLVQLLGLSVVVNGAVATPAALLQRYFKQGRRAAADQANVWVGAIVSVALAVAGFGAMSLVVGRLAGSVVSAVLLVAFSPEPYRLGFDRSVVRPLLSFGLPLAGASILVFAAGYLDQVVVGTTLGSVALGYYVLAFNLSNWPMTMFSQPLRAVAPALFARLQHEPNQMRGAFTRTLRPLGAIALPTCVVLSVASPEVVGFVYGEQWLPAAEALRWLAVLAALRIFVELAYDYLVVLGRSAQLFTLQLTWLIAMVPATVVGARLAGIGGAALGQVAVVLLVVIPFYLFLLRRDGLRARGILRDVCVPVAGAAVVAALVAVVTTVVAAPLLALVLAGVVALLAIGLLLLLARADLKALRATSATLT